MSLFGSALNMYSQSFSAVDRIAFSPFPFTLFTLPASAFFIAPFLIASFIPIMLCVALVSCVGSLCGPSYPRQPGYVRDTTPWLSSFGGLFDYYPSGPIVSRGYERRYPSDPVVSRSYGGGWGGSPADPVTAPSVGSYGGSMWGGGSTHVSSSGYGDHGPAAPNVRVSSGPGGR